MRELINHEKPPSAFGIVRGSLNLRDTRPIVEDREADLMVVDGDTDRDRGGSVRRDGVRSEFGDHQSDIFDQRVRAELGAEQLVETV
jgi:hypothetical protein